jgi:hypothetical protein
MFILCLQTSVAISVQSLNVTIEPLTLYSEGPRFNSQTAVGYSESGM